jgi:hypothetical protein
MKIISVFQLHELVTSEDLYVTYLKKLHIFWLGSCIGEQACYALSELPCGLFVAQMLELTASNSLAQSLQ